MSASCDERDGLHSFFDRKRLSVQDGVQTDQVDLLSGVDFRYADENLRGLHLLMSTRPN